MSTCIDLYVVIDPEGVSAGEAMTNKTVSPWVVVVISLLRSGRLLSITDQSSSTHSESYHTHDMCISS